MSLTFVRDPTCPNCRVITSGDCGMHGPRFYPTVATGGYVPSEVDNLKAQLAAKDAELQALVMKLRALPCSLTWRIAEAFQEWRGPDADDRWIRYADLVACLPPEPK